MNWLYHFHVLPWEIGRFYPHEREAVEAALEKMKKDAKD